MLLIAGLIIQPPTAYTRSKTLARTEFSEVTKDLNYFFSGGGVADYHDEYCFETSPLEIDRLISKGDVLREVVILILPL